MTSPMPLHEMLFGDKLDRTVQYIVGRAFQLNTPEAYQAAASKLGGIQTFLIFLEGDDAREESRMTIAKLAIANEIQRLYSVIDAFGGVL